MSDAWPALPSRWRHGTRDTVHLWCQLLGRTRTSLTPGDRNRPDLPLYVNSVGVTTSLLPLGVRGGLELVANLVDHRLEMRLTDGRQRRLQLGPRDVAGLYAEYVAALAELDVEVDVALPPGRADAPYDAQAARLFYATLVSAHRVLTRARTDAGPTTGPVRLVWGTLDLAVAGEVTTCGFRSTGGDDGVFHAHAVPEPPGFRDHVPRSAAYFDDVLEEFVLPYPAVRRALDPDTYVGEFLREIHDLATPRRRRP
ncbi:DUF5996 family protein [Nocardioides mangrovi]|uniref:DUF5996 family protein n=1 Tax=Nocardioides mangrovi TaxID=2874580 RepID=A0ABS7UI91_9ACTN|nr:DUF5996 family protein [Nocardioides mangrovi]MBZ5740322.1 DUF5996 family protein [Nocardioides mangrovi]